MTIRTEEYYISGYDELNRPPNEPETKLDKTDVSTSIWLTPEPTPDSQNVRLDLQLEMRRLISYEGHRYKGKHKYRVPQTEVVSTELPCLIPDGKTLLVVGLEMAEQEEEPHALRLGNLLPLQLADLPIIGGLFSICSNDRIKDHKILLVLIKPVVNPQQEATKRLPGHEVSLP